MKRNFSSMLASASIFLAEAWFAPTSVKKQKAGM